MAQAPQDEQGWHKHFAIRCNNRAWELSTCSARRRRTVRC
jgi:hypothetical protein